jgi:hypothetical protein
MSWARPSRVVKLAPSDLTFLWDECQRCFWLKVKGVLKRPSAPFPKIFTRIDAQTKDYFFGKRTEEMAPELRAGRVAFGDRWVRSSPLQIPGHRTEVTIQGKIDTALAFDDSSFGIIDFKTAEPKPEHVPFYSRQLHAYLAAAEHPAPGALELAPITQLGLLCVEPVGMVNLGDDVAIRGATTFLEIERDDDLFTAFLIQVLLVLERPEPPDPSPTCSHCKYLQAGSLVLMTEFYGGQG